MSIDCLPVAIFVILFELLNVGFLYICIFYGGFVFHRNSKQMDAEGKFCDELFHFWKFGDDKSATFSQKLESVLNVNLNPYHTLIILCSHPNKPTQNHFIKDVLDGQFTNMGIFSFLFHTIRAYLYLSNLCMQLM